MKPSRVLALVLVLLATTVDAATVRLDDDVVPLAQSVVLNVDPRKDEYSGSVTIDLDVKRPVTSFRFHAQDLTITGMSLTGTDTTFAKGDGGTIVVTTDKPLETGTLIFTADFTNKFNRQAVGLYKMLTKDGEPYLFTQFQAIDARRAFPVWDEPQFKIPFQLTVQVPEEYDAVSNSPATEQSLFEGLKTIQFARTKPLPSYLVALAVGKFDYTPINGMSVPGRVIAPKGQGHLTKLAAEHTPSVLAALEKYFDSKHPFEKVDLIAVPEYWAGAMENPGAITYRDTILLLDAATATPSQRQNLIRVTAHELAHMWFGDLVTMEWWNDFWLNESFADWMGDKITEELHPEFGHRIDELRNILRVMNADARATTDPIRKPDADPEEAMRNVGIAYDKGKSVLAMFERWIGPEKFRQGVLAHLKANAWGNANAGEFFASLAKHAPAGTAAAMETFINQPGIPLVTAEVVGANEVRLTQARFTTGKAAAQTWQIPVTMRYSDGKTVRTAAVLLDSASKTVKLEGERIEWLFPHAFAAGYYRWLMPEAAMTALTENATSVLEPAERLAMVGNASALFANGTIHGDAYLALLSRFANDPEPQVVSSVLAELGQLLVTFDSAENRVAFAPYLRRTLGPTLDRLGFTPKEGEAQTLTTLRPELFALLAIYGNDERIWRFVEERLRAYLKNSSSIHPTLATTLITLGSVRGDAALFEEYRKRFETASLPADRSRFLVGLGRFRDPALKAKAREYALSGPVRPNEMFVLIGGGSRAEDREEVYQWVTTNFDAIVKKLPPAFAAAFPSLAGGCEPERVVRAREFFTAKKIAGVERRLAQVEEQVNECAALRSREMRAVSEFLAAASR